MKSKLIILSPISTRRDELRPNPPPPSFKPFYITQKLAKLKSRNFVTFPKICPVTFIQKHFEQFCISEPLRVQRSAVGIFKNLKALDVSLIVYHWKVFFH